MKSNNHGAHFKLSLAGRDSSRGSLPWPVSPTTTKRQRQFEMHLFHIITIVFCLLSPNIFSQTGIAQKRSNSIFPEDVVKPRMRIIIDNDFGGDPDGLFQLVHHLLSPSVEIRGIIGSHLKQGDGFDPSKETAANAKKRIEEVLNIMYPGKSFPVYQGSNNAIENDSIPQKSDAANAIIEEAMRNNTKLPLYIVCEPGLQTLRALIF